VSGRCLLYPQKRTLIERVGMSALCQKRTFCAAVKTSLFDCQRVSADGPNLFRGNRHMKRLFAQAAVLATLLSGFLAFAFGDETLPIDPTSSDSVKVFALGLFERLQAGQINRTQMTAALSENLTDDSVKEMARYLKSYGPATSDEIIQTRKIQNQTFYVVKLFLQRGDALSLLIGFDESGKIAGITFPSMGRE
jgi:hypothetical protein